MPRTIRTRNMLPSTKRLEEIRKTIQIRGPAVSKHEKTAFLVNPTARPRKSWEETLMDLALIVAHDRSQDPFVQVGAAIVKHNNQIVLGYNGAPPGIEIDWSNRDLRRVRVIHAEENALNMVLPGEGRLMAVTHIPCEKCIKTIALKKIKKVVYQDILPGYDEKLVFQLAKEFGISLKKI